MGHLEDPALTSDLTLARDFDMGMTGPPLLHLDGLHRQRHGRDDRRPGVRLCALRVRLVGAAPLGRCVARHPLAAPRERGVAGPRDSGGARGAARGRVRLPPRGGSAGQQGAPSVRARRLDHRSLPLAADAGSTTCNTPPHDSANSPSSGASSSSSAASIIVFWSIAAATSDGRLTLAAAVVFAQSAVGASAIAFGGFSWALDGAAAPVGAVLRLGGPMAKAGALPSGQRPAAGLPARQIRFRDVTFAYPGGVAGPRSAQPDRSGRVVAGDRRPERRRQDDAGEAAVPPLRSAVRFDRDRWSRSARAGPERLASAARRGVPGFPAPRVAAPRQRGAEWRAGCEPCARRWMRPAPARSRISTPCWRAAIRAEPISPVANGNAWRWPGRSAR